MSIIAKMSVSAVRDFGAGSLIEFSCVCANDLMAAYAESHEDKLFTKYSPWGEARLHLPQGAALPLVMDTFYLLVLRPDEIEADHIIHPAASYIAEATCSITDRGEGVAKTLEFAGGGAVKGDDILKRAATSFNWRMAVDNPGATDQLTAGKSGYWIGFYPVSKFDRDETIAAAHGSSE